jgi:pyridoxamine 5'-phosphate oxidase
MSEAGNARDLAAMRRNYDRAPLRRGDLAATWDEQLRAWLADAGSAGVPEPNAMVLATSTAEGRPSTRTVLLKDLGPDRLTFFTNYHSQKGRELARNGWCAVTFPWIAMGRQVTIAGVAARGSDEDADAYFASRPYGSQIGAIASDQSQRIEDRATLETRFREAAERYPEGSSVPRPVHWGGYELSPRTVEFWQGRPDRLHDRLRYARAADGSWLIERLAP